MGVRPSERIAEPHGSYEDVEHVNVWDEHEFGGSEASSEGKKPYMGGMM